MKLSTKKLRKIINESIKGLILEAKNNFPEYSFKIKQGPEKQSAQRNLVYLGSVPQTKDNLKAVGNFGKYLPDMHKNIPFESAEKEKTLTVEAFLKDYPSIDENNLHMQLIEQDVIPDFFRKYIEKKDRDRALKMYNEKIKNYTPKITQDIGRTSITGNLFLFLVTKG